jgi:CRISPR-associated protein Cas6
MVQPFVDVAFPLQGTSIPLDHGYALFGAVSRLIPRVHQEPTWGVHPVHGKQAGPGVLSLLRSSLLTLRVPTDAIGELLPLTGQTLDVAGSAVKVGTPRIFQLQPRPALRSRFVTIKKFMEPGPELDGAIRRQLTAMELRASVTVDVGARRVQRVSNHTIVGFALALDGLSADESIRVQTTGLGGRRHMGAGLFLPSVKSE